MFAGVYAVNVSRVSLVCRTLDVSNNQLVGAITPVTVALTNLRVLAVGSNLLTGAIPTSISALRNLLTWVVKQLLCC